MSWAPAPRVWAPAPIREVGPRSLGPTPRGSRQVVGSFVSRCRAGWAFVCRGQRTRSSRSSLESHLSRVDASSAWRVRTVPQAAPRVPGRQERCEGSGVRGWGSGASRVLGSAVRGVCALTRALLSPGIQVPCLSSGLAHTVRLGQGRGSVWTLSVPILGQTCPWARREQQQEPPSGQWVRGGLGLCQVVGAGRGVPLAGSGAGHQEAWSAPRPSFGVSGGPALLCWGAGV